MNQTPQQPNDKRYSIISAEEYEKLRQEMLKKSVPQPQHPGLMPSDKLCRSIEAMAASLAVAIIEGLIGRRPLSHIERWFSKTCFDKVKRRAAVTRDAIACQYANPALQYMPYSRNVKLPRVKRSRAQRVAEGKYEVCVVITDSQRTRAMALRIEKTKDSWHITDLEIA